MTIASQVSRNDYVGNGSTSVFPYTFQIFVDADLKVTTVNTAGVETVLTLATDYTVTGAGGANGGNVTLVAGNLTSGYGITIRRERDLTQLTDIRNQGPFFPESHENEFDDLIMIAQQLKDALDRSLKLQETEAGTALLTTLPAVVARANHVLGFDSAGNPIATSGGITGLLVSAYIQTLLGAANSAAARATLEVTLTNLGISAYIQTLLDDVNASAAQTTLGISAFIKTLLDDADAATARGTLGVTLTNLGVSAFIQTLVDDADAATARATLGVDTLFKSTSITQTAPITTNSVTDVAIAGLTITPVAGDYEVLLEAIIETPVTGDIQTISIYADGVQVAGSERGIRLADARLFVATSAIVTVNGSQAIDGRWRTASGSPNMDDRRLRVLRVTT